MSSDLYGDSSTSGRRSPPYDVQKLRGANGSGELQIRGLARDQEDGEITQPSVELYDTRRTPPRGSAYYREDHWRSRDHRDDAYDEDRDYGRPRDYDEDAFYDRRSRRRSWSRTRSYSPRRFGERYQDLDASRYSPSPERGLRYEDSSPRRTDRQPVAPPPPNRVVMLEGLPVDMFEDNIKEELKAYKVDNLESIVVVRDKQTGISRRFGFLTFSTIGQSRAFVEANEPLIYLYGNSTTSANQEATPVKIAFYRSRKRTESEWECPDCLSTNFLTRKTCRQCGASGTDADTIAPPGPPPQPVNTGDSDVSLDNTPTQYLLFRSLAPTIGPEMLAKGAAKLYKTHERPSPTKDEPKEPLASTKIISTHKFVNSGARPGCIRRVLLIRDRRTNDSWRFGFVEYAAVDDAKAAMAKYLSLDKFTIGSKPVTVSYPHAGVFIPDLNSVPGTEQFTFPSAANQAMNLIYRDTGAYAEVLVVSTEANDPHFRSSRRSSRDEGTAKPKKRKADADPTVLISTSKKQLAPHLQFWTKRGQELRGAQNPASESTSTPGVNDTSTSTSNANPASESQPTQPPAQSYADPTKHCCYLCARQFKSAPEVHKHERLSALHKTNLTDPALVSKAQARLQNLGIPLVSSKQTATESEQEQAEPTQEYRDRAKERRRQNPQEQTSQSQSTQAKHAVAKAQAKDPSPPSAPPAQSKAAAMMAKMGHVTGSGLGSSGSGTTAAIATNVYAAGVGLGAEGGMKGDAVEVAERATKGDYASYVKDVREKARERLAREG